MAKVTKPKEAVKAVVPEPKEKVVKEFISVIFRDDRKFDLHIGREMMTFKAHERRDDVPKEWLKHPDWQHVAKYFVVKGV